MFYRSKQFDLIIIVLLANLIGIMPSMANVVLKIESWRYEDTEIWNNSIIPAFERDNPGIKLRFVPSIATDYDAGLSSRLENDRAGDLITCRAFDKSLKLFWRGHLVPVTAMPGMENFSTAVKSAWSTDDLQETYCVPIASVIHGFIYNKRIFKELGLEKPTTEAEFFNLLKKIKDHGQYTPLAIGSADKWELATVGYQNIGPNYWKGEEGRLGIISGQKKLTDRNFVAPMQKLAKWSDFMGDSFKTKDIKIARSYSLIAKRLYTRRDRGK